MSYPAQNALPAFVQRHLRTSTPSALLILGAVVALAGCDGQNLFGGPGGQSIVDDVDVPTIEIERPGSGTTIPTGDSLLVAVGLTDDAGIDTVRIRGLAFRGDPTLGTDETVARYEARTIVLEELPSDTVVQRYLQPNGDGASENVSIIAEATDLGGNLVTDTAVILVGAPRVDVPNLSSGDTVQAGRDLAVRVQASDEAGIGKVTLDFGGIASGSIVETFSPAQESVTVDTAISLPDGTTGELTLVAKASNTLNQQGRTDTLRLAVTTTATTDTIAPMAALQVDADLRMELSDSIRIAVEARDETGGGGIARVGATALAINSTGTDTLTWSEVRSYGTPRTGTVVEDFRFTPEFRADTLALPDSLIFEVYAYAVDDAGNCGASAQADFRSDPCGAFAGDTVAANIIGDRVDVIAVEGYTVGLSTDARLADAVVDADTAESRYRLYVSHLGPTSADDGVAIINLTDSAYVGDMQAGSRPWGLFLENSRDTLLVANSGGTNISFMPLQTGGDPDHVPAEALSRRLLTPEVVLYDLEIKTNDVGAVTYIIHRHGFSDRPQFIAQDSTGRYLYSTAPTSAAPDGTVRVVDEDPDPLASNDIPEARILFDESKATEPATDFMAIANIDSIVVDYDPAFGDVPSFCDHAPGHPDQATCVAADTVSFSGALDSLQTVTGDEHLFSRGSARWVLDAVGMSDTTFVSAAGDRGTVAFGEGATAPTGRVMLWHAHTDPDSAKVSEDLYIDDLVDNASDRVLGVGLNRNGSFGVLRGEQAAYFFNNQLRQQGSYVAALGSAGAGAALHPAHDDVLATGTDGLAFIGSSDQSILVISTVHFAAVGEIPIRENIIGTLRVVHPLPGDNGGQGAACTGEHCIVAKLFGITESGVVIVNVKRRDLDLS